MVIRFDGIMAPKHLLAGSYYGQKFLGLLIEELKKGNFEAQLRVSKNQIIRFAINFLPFL